MPVRVQQALTKPWVRSVVLMTSSTHATAAHRSHWLTAPTSIILMDLHQSVQDTERSAHVSNLASEIMTEPENSTSTPVITGTMQPHGAKAWIDSMACHQRLAGQQDVLV
jgi:hypothetical protein